MKENSLKKMKTNFFKDKLDKLKEAINTLKWLNFYVKDNKKYFITIIILNIITISIGLYISVLSKELIDIVIGHKESLIVKTISIVIGVTIIRILFTSINKYINSKLRIKIKTDLRTTLYKKTIDTKWELLRNYHSADIINRFEGDINGACSGIVSIIPTLVTQAFKFIAVLVMIFINDKIMALLTFISAPVMFFSSYILMHKISKYNKEIREVNSDILKVNQEAYQNNAVIKVFDTEYQYLHKMKDLLNRYSFLYIKQSKIMVFIHIGLSIVSIFVSYLCFGWGIYRLWQGSISFGTMMLFLSLATSLRTSFSTVINQLPAIIRTSIYVERIKEIMSLESEEVNNNEIEDVDYIEAKDMSFSYLDSSIDALEHINFKINKGEIVGLIGSTGEGKTTLIRLILGLIEPNSGQLSFVSNNVSNKASSGTRRLVSYVPQENNVFSGTILDNLRLGNKNASEKDIEKALEIAEIYDFVYSLPNRLNTILSEEGSNISQGQRQRIAIARALLKPSKVLILDEATSSLDVKTEEKIIENIINSHDLNKIILISTHRVNTLSKISRIFSVENHNLLEK